MKSLNSVPAAIVLSLLTTLLLPAVCNAREAAPPEDPAWIKGRFLGSDTDLASEARTRKSRGDFSEAAKLFENMAKRASTEANRVYALRQQAECLFRAEKLDQAYNAYRELGENYPRQVDFQQINSNLRRIAEKYAAGEAGFLGGKDLEKAREIYKLILVFSPAGAEAPSDTMRLAELQQQDRLREKAIVTYREVLRKFPTSEQAPYARLALAELYVHQAQETRDRWEPARVARRTVDQYLEQYPEHPSRNRAEAIAQAADEELARDLLYLGSFYARPAHYRPEVARRYLSDLLREYSHTSVATEAKVLLARIEGKPVSIAEAGRPGMPGEGEMTPEELLLERRKLPPIPHSGEITGEDGREPAEPQAPLLIDERERVEKWLRPVPDLGISTEE